MILAAAFGCGVGLTGLPFYTFGLFIKPLGEAFGWPRTEVAAGTLCLSAGTVLLSPVVGALVDRLGAARVAIPSLAGLAIGFLLLSRTGPGIGSFYLAWLALAALGCATTPLAWTQAIGLRFDRSRGLALGLALMGTGIAGLLGPRAVQAAIAAHGWRGGYWAMALFVALVALPVCLFGLAGGGAAAAHDARPATARFGVSVAAGLRSGAFWMIAASIFLVILAQASMTVHFVPLLTDGGLTPAAAASIAGLVGVAIIVGRLVVGLLVDRFDAPLVAATFFVMPALALALLAWRVDGATAGVAAVLLGLAAGAEVDILAYLVSRFFGLRSYGRLYGVQLSIFGLGAGLGPPLTGHVYDTVHSYRPAMLAGVALFLVAAALMALLSRMPRADRRDG